MLVNFSVSAFEVTFKAKFFKIEKKRKKEAFFLFFSSKFLLGIFSKTSGQAILIFSEKYNFSSIFLH